MSEDLIEGKKTPVKRRIALRSSGKLKANIKETPKNNDDLSIIPDVSNLNDNDNNVFDESQSLFDVPQVDENSASVLSNDSNDSLDEKIEQESSQGAINLSENNTSEDGEKKEYQPRTYTKQSNYNKRTRGYQQKPHYNPNFQSPYQSNQNSYLPNPNLEPQIEEINPDAPIIYVNDYNSLSIYELRDKAVSAGIDKDAVLEMKKQEIVSAILKQHAFLGGVIHASGTLEILQDGYGFLRSELNSYLQGPEDVFVSPQIIKANGLKTGDSVYCMLRNPKASERFFAVFKVLKVNDEDASRAKGRIPFDSLTPLYPDTMINLEGKKQDLSMRVIDMFSPIGKGQRALITAPPRTGKTIILQKIANAITDNYPDIKLMVLLVDERPEEVTDMRRNVKGEVIASTFDEQAQRHVNVAEMVIEKAKRYVEYGHDVVILLDSITRLARAYNQTAPASGKVLSGGVDSNALHKPKRFFGAARNIENGGSLTIIATALIETGSRMDEVIFEEFKGTGNCEIVLDRKMAENRIYPAINLKKSGTRREELLIENDKLQRIWLLRNALNNMDDVEMSEMVLDKMKKSDNNEMFMKSMGN